MGLDVLLMKNPRGEFSSEDGDRSLDVSFGYWEWESFFYAELGVPKPEPYADGEDIGAYRQRQDQRFRESLSKYPMLSRIYDYYIDVVYLPNEVKQLLDECSPLEEKITNREALGFLNGLIYACKEALRLELGIFLRCD
jgi:hypothetical protein